MVDRTPLYLGGTGVDGNLTVTFGNVVATSDVHSSNAFIGSASEGYLSNLLVGYGTQLEAFSRGNRIQVAGNNSDVGFTAIRYRSFGASEGSQLILGHVNNDTIGGSGIVSDDLLLGSVIFVGHDGTDLENAAAHIQALVDGTPAGNQIPGRIVFSTTSSAGGNPTEAVRIDSSQRVGIGNTTPSVALVVSNTTDTKILLNNSARPNIRLQPTGSNIDYEVENNAGTFGIRKRQGGVQGNTAIDITTNDSATTRLTITSQATGGATVLRAKGDTNTPMNISSEGTGDIVFLTGDTGTEEMRIDGSTGAITTERNPRFFIEFTDSHSNMTGNGNTYSTAGTGGIGLGGTVEREDAGGDITLGTFTAPVDGTYCLSVSFRAQNLTSASATLALTIATSNRIYNKKISTDSTEIRTHEGQDFTIQLTVPCADMDASDTATGTFRITGEASDVVDMIGTQGSTAESYFMGYLVG